MSSASRPGMPGECSDVHCITCGDVAETMRVLKIDAERELALCTDQAGERHTIEIALVQPVAVDDELLVHAGTAIGRNTPGRVAEEVLR